MNCGLADQLSPERWYPHSTQEIEVGDSVIMDRGVHVMCVAWYMYFFIGPGNGANGANVRV